jgi:hypothetical protein
MAQSTLQAFIADNAINTTVAMNVLQDYGVVSDNCVTPGDVAKSDCEGAIKFITVMRQMDRETWEEIFGQNQETQETCKHSTTSKDHH